MSELLRYVPRAEDRQLAGEAIRRFEEAVQPRLSNLRWQVIYNDLNPSNVLVDERDSESVVGIIDFGDLVSCPLVVDVAIAAAYQLRHTPDPIDAAIEFVAAYHEVLRLEVEEIELLCDLMVTRIASAAIITAWHATIQPHNRDYILRNAATHGDMLARFNQMSANRVRQRFQAACR